MLLQLLGCYPLFDDLWSFFGDFILSWSHLRWRNPVTFLRRGRDRLLFCLASLLRDIVGLKISGRVLVVLNYGIVEVLNSLAMDLTLYLMRLLLNRNLRWRGNTLHHRLHWYRADYLRWRWFHRCLTRRALHLADIDLMLLRVTSDDVVSRRLR